MKSFTTKQKLALARNNEVEKGNQLITGLHTMGTDDADKMADAIADEIVIVGNEHDKGIAAIEANSAAQIRFRVATGQMKETNQGIASMVALANPELRKKLPTETELSSVVPDYVAERMADVFEAEGGQWLNLAPILREAAANYRTTGRAYQDAVTEQKTLRDTTASFGELKLRNLQAEIYIRRNALPGTPAFNALNSSKKHPKKKAAAADTKPAAETKAESNPAETKPAEAKVEAPAVNVVVPAANSSVLNGASHA